jgi:hypothetical protein
VGADLLRLLIAAVVVGEEEEESRTVRGGIETDVVWHGRGCFGVGFLPKFDVPSAVVYYPPPPLYHIGILMAAYFGRVAFAVMCRASCRHGVVWTAFGQVHKMEKRSCGEERY